MPESKGVVKEEKNEEKPCWQKVLTCIFFPFILVYYSCIIYLFPCIGVYLKRCCCAIWCCLCSCCRNCCLFTDSDFPASSTSLGDWHGKTQAQLDQDVVWLRGDEIFERLKEKEAKSKSAETKDAKSGPQHMCLFADDIEPNDIGQGKLGNCWLMSAFACLAEHPGLIQHVFETKEYHPRGIYKIRIFDSMKDEWVVLEVDDFFPCDSKTHLPIFAQPKDNELWVLLLEKAFAKFCGSYQALSGGNPIWAMQAMTGDKALLLKRKKGQWGRWDLVHYEDDDNKRDIRFRSTDDKYSPTDVWELLLKYDERDALIAAGTSGDDDTKEIAGLASGHAYSVIHVIEASDGGHDFQLMCLRNPWGTCHWDGAWSATDGRWEQYPKVKKACKFERKQVQEDGVFWISFNDFQIYFSSVDICGRHTGLDDLRLDIREQDGCPGVFKGCVSGCCTYYYCCQGCKALCCAKESSNDAAVPVRRYCCDSCLLCPRKHIQVSDAPEAVVPQPVEMKQ